MPRRMMALALVFMVLSGCSHQEGAQDVAVPPGQSGTGSAKAPAPPVELSKEKTERLANLSAQLAEQQRNIWDLPDNAKLLQLDEELNTFCSAADLVAVTWVSDHGLAQAAFGLLSSSRAAELSAQDAANLLKHLDGRARRRRGKRSGPVKR